jgi:hypothetical protein
MNIDHLLNKLDIFYCDNRGVIQRILQKETLSLHLLNEYNGLNITVDSHNINERQILTKILPQTNLNKIINFQKSEDYITKNINNYNENNNHAFDRNFLEVLFLFFFMNINFILNYNIFLFKIELTPAYLLPKMNSFCNKALKSMLYKKHL